MLISKKILKVAGLLLSGLVLAACEKEVKDNGMGEFLPVEKAFVLTVNSVDKNTVNASWKIAEGYHLYKDKFEFSLGNDDYQISALDMPKGTMIEDKIFGKQESYAGALDVKIALKEINPTGKVIVKTRYQGCSDKGLCYPPQSVESEIML